jgi:hypothetical protein
VEARCIRARACRVVVAALAVSCGSGSGGSAGGSPGSADAGDSGGHENGVGTATVMGNIEGKAFSSMDAVAYFPGDISIVDFPGLCARGVSEAKPGATYLNMFLGNGFALGTATVGATGTTLTVQNMIVDSQCNSMGENASGGTVTLTAVKPDSVSGTFDFTFPSGKLTGSFSAAMCTMPGSTACK